MWFWAFNNFTEPYLQKSFFVGQHAFMEGMPWKIMANELPGKWIVCQHCRDKMRGSWPFGPDPSINSVVIWGLSQWCSRQSEAVLPRTGNWATQVANFFSSTSKRKLQRGKNRSKELWKRHPKRYFFWEAIGGWSPKGRQPGQAGEPGWEGTILLPRPD